MKRGPRARAALIASVCALAACAGEPGPNLVLVILDATSAQRLSPYGAPADATPRLAALAEDSVVFETSYSQTPATITSTASLLASLRAPSHRVTPAKRLPSEVEVFPEALQRAGYTNVALIGNPYAGAPGLGFRRGYDRFVEVYRLDLARGNPPGASVRYAAVTPENMNAVALREIAGMPEVGFFLHLHYLTPHTPWNAPAHFHDRGAPPPAPWPALERVLKRALRSERASEAELARLEQAYRASVRWADAGVGALLDALRRADRYEESLIVVAADHGEAFTGGERIGHNDTLYDDMTRIPLMIKFPRSAGIAPRRVAALAETIDIAPTLLDFLGLPVPDDFEGESLLALARGERGASEAAREVLISTAPGDSHAIRVGSHKLITWTGRPPELYDLESDPGETRNLAAQRPELAALLERRLAETLARARPGAEPDDNRLEEDPAMRALLEALGYLEPESEPAED